MAKTHFKMVKQVDLVLKAWDAPNFAIATDETGGDSIPINQLPENILKEMADNWVDNLYRKANEQRMGPLVFYYRAEKA